MYWYWHFWSSHLSCAVINWQNSEANHSLTAFVHYNHHLEILPYLNLPFELHSYCCPRTDNHSHTRHNGMLHQPDFIKVSPAELAVLPWRLQAFHCGLKHRPSPSVCLNYTVFGMHMISNKIYLNLSKYVDKLLMVKTLINIKHIGWKY